MPPTRCPATATVFLSPTDLTRSRSAPRRSISPASRSACNPSASRRSSTRVLRVWARAGIDGMFTTDRPWFTYDDSLREPMARIVGARPTEVALLNTLTVNIHLLLTSFFRPSGRRRRILVDAPLFPSDRHALTSHLAARGLDPVADLIVVTPRAGEATLRTSDIEAAIAEHADELALVFLAGVNFATGQAHDIGRLTAAGRAAGAVVGWDLAHAAGNIELELHDWDVDFAAWCTYKYLNGGPGSIGALFVHERHGSRRVAPAAGRLVGHRSRTAASTMDGPFVPSEGAAGWKASTNPVLSLAPLVASLAIFDEVGMPALRARSMALTAIWSSASSRSASTSSRRAIRPPAAPSCRSGSAIGGYRRGGACAASPRAASSPISAPRTSSGWHRCRSTTRTTRRGRWRGLLADTMAAVARRRGRGGYRGPARGGLAAGCPGRTCGPCPRTGPACSGRPSPGNASARRHRRTERPAEGRRR